MEEMLQLLKKFESANPCNFTKEQFEKVKSDIVSPRERVVWDEYVDFTLWRKGLKTRQEYFAEYIADILKVDNYNKLLEVGCGATARLSSELIKKGYAMTAMDPQIDLHRADTQNVKCKVDTFIWDSTDISRYDAVVAQEPCDASEHVVRACVAQQKNFVMTLCGTPHIRLDGVMPQDTYEWHDYLKELGGDKCVLIRPKMIPGYITSMLIGIF